MSQIEEAFIGSMLIQPDNVGLYPVKPEHFEQKELAAIWSQLTSGNTDGMLIIQKLGSEYEQIMCQCIEVSSGTASQSLEKQAHSIIKSFESRSMKLALTKAYGQIESGLEVDDVLGELMKTTIEHGDSGYVHVAEIVNDVYRSLETKDRSKFMPTGFSDLDFLTGGIERKNLIIVAGRPSMGKTAFAMGVCLNVAKTYQTAFNSVEMDNESVGNRMLSSISEMDLKLLRTGAVKSAEAWSKAASAVQALSKLNFYIDDNAKRTASQIAASARRQKMRYGLDFLMIDYVGLLNPENARKSRQEQVADMTKTLKQLSKELDIGIMLLCQLNREAEGQIPNLSHLRESGAVEQDADVVLFPRRFKNDLGDEEAEVIVAKQRNGPTGVVPMIWHGSTASYKPKKEIGF